MKKTRYLTHIVLNFALIFVVSPTSGEGGGPGLLNASGGFVETRPAYNVRRQFSQLFIDTLQARANASTEFQHSGPVLCPKSCGLPSVHPQFIFERSGDNKIVKGEHPWMVRLKITSSTGEMSDCAGTILNSRYVLTAAHCFKDKEAQHAGVELPIRGDWTTQNFRSPVVIKISHAYIHPLYNRTYTNSPHDVAVVVTDTWLPLQAGYMTPVCLYPGAVDRSVAGVVAGWDATPSHDGATSQHWKKAEASFKDTRNCRKHYNLLNVEVWDDQFCASEDIDECIAVSGGPLLVYAKARWRQVGITSYGIGCSNPYFPAIYTSVSDNLEWIKANVDGGTCHVF